MKPISWQELETEFKTEMTMEWFDMYPRKEYIERIIKKVFHYYSTHQDPPRSRDAWKRALAVFLENGWKQENSPPSSSTKIPPRGGVPFVRSAPRQNEVPKKIDDECTICWDLRVVRVISKDLKHDTLMLCGCADPLDKSNWKLPQWDPGLGEIYFKERCPLEWFKPQLVNGKADVGIEQKAREWRGRVSTAERFWVEMNS